MILQGIGGKWFSTLVENTEDSIVYNVSTIVKVWQWEELHIDSPKFQTPQHRSLCNSQQRLVNNVRLSTSEYKNTDSLGLVSISVEQGIGGYWEPKKGTTCSSAPGSTVTLPHIHYKCQSQWGTHHSASQLALAQTIL